MLQQTLQASISGELLSDADALVNAWKKGDEAALIKLLKDASKKDKGSEALMKRLLDDRNVGMAEKSSNC